VLSGLVGCRRECVPSTVGLYDAMYRVGYTPWEHPGPAWTSSLAQGLDLEESERGRPLGRALDVGCGRGQHARELVRRGWDVVGIDYAPRAIDAALRQGLDRATFMVGDVTNPPATSLGTFDFFLDIGCFQHLDAGQRAGAGRGMTTVANPAATLLMMAFSRPTPIGSFVKGISPDDVQAAFPGWDLLSVHDAPTDGMDWPMRRMSPTWMRLRRRS
jgi:SAM-dependent methyltransferase